MGVLREGPEWREAVLEQVLLWTVRLGSLLAVLALVTVGSAARERLLEPGFVLMLAAYACMIGLRYQPGLSYRSRAWGFCLLLWVLGTSAMYNVGLLPAPVLANTLAVVSAGLFLGRRPMFLLLGLSTLGVVVLGVWTAAGHGPGLVGERLDHLLGPRLAVGYAVVTATIALLVGYVVTQIERSLSITSEALRRLSLAEQHRSHAEQALEQTQSALQRSQKLEAVGRLAAGVGHDFNNSLQVVLSWASLLQGERDPELLDEGLAAIRQAAVQGSELTQRLLAFGRRDVRASRIMVALDLLEDGSRSLRRMLPEDISIVLESQLGPRASARVRVDSSQVAHVLLNLGLNARDAMPMGGRLTLGLRSLHPQELPVGPPWPEGPERWVELSVRDTGSGMSALTQAHIFEPFFTTKGERGNGLGLATAHALVERNAGFIRAESELQRGSTFYLYFPEEQAELDTVVATPTPPCTRLGASVMVAEDDPGVRSSLVRVLDAAGFRVFESPDAATAISLLERVGAEIDVLCTYGIMPGGGTRELIDRYLSCRPAGKVIVCSGYVKEELLRRQIDAGALAYLAKPFPPSELVERINGLLKSGAGAGSVEGGA